MPSDPPGHRGRGWPGDLCVLEVTVPPPPQHPWWENRGESWSLFSPGHKFPQSYPSGLGATPAPGRGSQLSAKADRRVPEEQQGLRRNLPAGLCPPGHLPPLSSSGEDLLLFVRSFVSGRFRPWTHDLGRTHVVPRRPPGLFLQSGGGRPLPGSVCRDILGPSPSLTSHPT